MIRVPITTMGVVGVSVSLYIVSMKGVGQIVPDIPIVVDILPRLSARPAQHFYEPLPRQGHLRYMIK